MTKTTALTESFAAGEITPLLYGRVSSEGYKQGVKSLTNMLTDPRGALLRRSGLEFRSSIPVRTEARKASFQYSQVINFDLDFADNIVTITPSKAQNFGEEAVRNGDFELEGSGWGDISHANASVVFVNEKCRLTPGILAGEDAVIRRVITIKEPSIDHTYETFGIFQGASAGEGTDIALGSALGLNDLLNVNLYDAARYNFSNTVAVGAGVKVYLTITVKAQTSKASVDAVVPTYIDSISLKPRLATPNINASATPYSGSDVAGLHTHMTPDGTTMYLVHKDYLPHELVYTASTDTWALTPVAFTAIPAEWVAGSYPSTVTTYQGRAIWGGLQNDPETFWLSKSGTFDDMTIGILAADGYKFKIADQGLIKWIVGAKNLLIGTDNSEFIVTAESGLLTPTDTQVDQQSAFGSGNVQPIKMGTEVLYVSPDGLKLRTMGYSWTDSGWISQDLTEASEHITEGGIISMAYARNPDSIIWMALQTGRVISCSYRHIGGKTPVIGWHKHDMGAPVLSVSVLEYKGTSIPWFSMLREVAGEPLITSESMFSKEDDVFTDGTKVAFGNVASANITGLERFEGQVVHPVVDGALSSPVTVVGGAITLDYPGFYVTVGSHSNAKITTLPLVLYGQGQPEMYGRKRLSRLFLQIYKSALPLIFGKRVADRNPVVPMGIAEPLTTGFIDVTQLGWREKGIVEIEQDLPLPLILTALTGDAKHNKI